MGSSIKFKDIETEIGKCFPIQLVVCVSFSSSVGTQIDSKSKIARFLKSSLSSETGRFDPSSFWNEAHTRSLGKYFSLDPCISEDVCWEIGSFEESVTTRTPETFKELSISI